MEWMARNIGDEYLKTFGQLCLDGYEIQNIIDALWVLYEGKNEGEIV